MRNYISIVEARPKKIVPPADPAIAAQALYDQTLAAARTIAHALMLRTWNQDWVNALRAEMAAARQRHDANEQAEGKYYHDDGGEYQPKPFVLSDNVAEITARWWDQSVKPQLDDMYYAARHEYERYQDEHPMTEQSDQMSLLQDEIELTQHFRFKGSDTSEGMSHIVDAIGNFASSMTHYRDIDYLNIVTRETEDFIARIIPAILTICRLYGAKKTQ